MCFAPEMDLAVGAVITVVGIDALRHVSDRRQLPIAALPVLFGVHQLIETLVWWDLQGKVSSCTGDVAAWIYVLIALTLVPIVVPIAFLVLGTGRSRRLGTALVLAGTAAGLSHFASLVEGPVGKRIEGHHIVYNVGLPYVEITLALYVLACCVPGLIARPTSLQVFGVANIAAAALLVWLDQTAVISLWCVWAAISSVLLNVYLRRTDHREVAASSQ
ncbi:DUF6629 family protein [Nocardioides sp. Root190]|uniref:DUF6629 family protein n=1 Tax=Nocardioides sp. Root190 TaxID=1736488 RepID=UPI000ACA9416|nr:DUF6629 family protein [Nocardioides sp. Root190]